eukprot:TRINITY_DN27083_c0_g1_i1.p1 TRINITY_DN27083_c0_g1~~TRINITY_DN27083_c0_g1_i1.p1  ORF type:complete len:199 (-),score=38.55 TRINITY_DN27083_c0_g1_i1:18-614(-)
MPDRKVFNFTYVAYEEGDRLGKIMAVATLSPMLVAFGLGSDFVVTRRIAWAWALLGAIVVDAGCIVLKEIINQARPAGSYRSGPGMPSEHAAFSVFLAVHLSLWLLSRTRCALSFKAVASAAMTGWALVVTLSRHHLGVHSLAQVLAGMFLGAVAGLLWFLAEGVLEVHVLAKLQRLLDKMWKAMAISFDDYSAGHDE